MKSLLVCALFVVSAVAEPPVDNRYLPPSQSYGPPNAQFGGQRQTDALLRNQPSANYEAPSPQYGAPNRGSRPSAQYGPPAFGNQMRQNSAPPRGLPTTPSIEYGAPSPSQMYGAPGRQNAGARQYLPPNRRGYDGDDEGSNEPANYNFEYMVKDDASGNDFGHRESRQGDRAEGVYYVVLPDGRKQTVMYEADEDGYRPKISYEDTGMGQFGGYDGNDQSGRGNHGNQGYQGQGYPSGSGGPY